MNILKTFENFLKLPISIFKNNLFKIVHIENNFKNEINDKYLLNVDLVEKTPQITIVNNKKMYNLLCTTMYKRKMLNENKKCKIFN